MLYVGMTKRSVMSTKTETDSIDSAGGLRSEPGGRAQQPAGAPLEIPATVRDRLADEVIDELLAGARHRGGDRRARRRACAVDQAAGGAGAVGRASAHLGYEPHQ